MNNINEVDTTDTKGLEILTDLVNTCVKLAYQAGAVIRHVDQMRSGPDAKGNDLIGAKLKDPNDTRSYLTVADQLAQKVIVDGKIFKVLKFSKP